MASWVVRFATDHVFHLAEPNHFASTLGLTKENCASDAPSHQHPRHNTKALPPQTMLVTRFILYSIIISSYKTKQGTSTIKLTCKY